uniref:Membrane anchored junction protein n=1 Tax=Pipistrellus kuhlii TaxID=59472 RepID=A0A7J7R181_PIPKU|nr:membrane anchored junction protein [Pipistrellus kuhlii]
MSLKPFTYPFPETRFLHSGTSVYKFKIRYGDSIRGEDVENKEVIIQELENRERNTQQGCQEPPAFDGADGQAQGSRWEESPPGETSPPLQQSNAPPPAGPTGPGTGGFFGFLSSFFPFRYFFGKSSQ